MTKKKIKDLALFEVYSYNGAKFIYLNRHEVVDLTTGYSIDLRRPSVLEEEVEVLGKMEFKPEEVIAEHICDNRCLGDGGHHAWPSPQNKVEKDLLEGLEEFRDSLR